MNDEGQRAGVGIEFIELAFALTGGRLEPAIRRHLSFEDTEPCQSTPVALAHIDSARAQDLYKQTADPQFATAGRKSTPLTEAGTAPATNRAVGRSVVGPRLQESLATDPAHRRLDL